MTTYDVINKLKEKFSFSAILSYFVDGPLIHVSFGQLYFDLPIFSESNKFVFNNVDRIGSGFVNKLGEVKTFTDCFYNHLAQHMMRCFIIAEDDPGLASRTIGSIINAFCTYQPLANDTDLADYIMSKRVLIEHIENQDPEEIFLDRLENYDLEPVDMLATTQSDRIGVVGHLKEPGLPYSASLIKSPFLIYDASKRYLVIHAGMTQIAPLLEKELPIIDTYVSIPSPEGRNLRTLFMVTEGNFNDNILISQSAADKLACIVRKPYMLTTHNICELKIGEEYNRGEVLSNNPGVATVLDIPTPSATLETMVKYFIYDHLGEMSPRTRLVFKCIYPMSAGCKITNRHGNKVTVNIKPDRMMPLVDGIPVEVVANPISIERRKNFGQVLEAVFSDFILKNEGITHYDISEDPESYSYLAKSILAGEKVSEAYPTCFKKVVDIVDAYSKEQSIGYEMDDPIISGTVFWMRLNKHACDMFTYSPSRNNYYHSHGAKVNWQMLSVLHNSAPGLADELINMALSGGSFATDCMNSINLCGRTDQRNMNGPVCTVGD